MGLPHFTYSTACSFGKHAKYTTRFQLFVGCADRLAVGLTTFHGKRAEEAHEPGQVALKSLFLCHVDYSALDKCRNERDIYPCKVVGRNNECTLRGYILAPNHVYI